MTLEKCYADKTNQHKNIMTEYPSLVTIRQHLPRPHIEDVAGELSSRMFASGMLKSIKPGNRIAITAGSRGIADLPLILRTVVTVLRSTGAEPFIVPAMGSHGGGTADGQASVLASLGITEFTVGAPVRSSMETLLIGETSEGIPVFCDRLAYESDGIVVMNRVKVHTAFHGDIESGLTKMLAVGLGKLEGAETMHKQGLGTAITSCARTIMEKAPILAGIAIAENAGEEIMEIRVVLPAEFETVDRELLVASRTMLPRIPVDSFDILIVDEMGKDISGTGMDTNVIGFWRRYGGTRNPDYQTLFVRSLTPASNGNAMGIGMADMITRRMQASIDVTSTIRNAQTSQASLGIIPMVCENDRDCIDEAILRCPHLPPHIVRIHNTRDLEILQVTADLAVTLKNNNSITVIGSPESMRFDNLGFLI